MSLALELAHKIKQLTYKSLPAAAVQCAKAGLLDTIGVTLAGASEDATRILLGVTSGSGSAQVMGHNRRVSALDAAMINGTASHALDFDDCSTTMNGHPSAPILSAMFALSDEIGVSGEAFIAAYVAGFETACKISLGVNLYQYTLGWHPTGTLGVFGSAAACAHLLQLSPEKTATALSIAASFSSGIKSNFGSMTKPLHVGHSARNGLFAALIARDGFTAGATAFEHKQGYFEVFNGTGNYHADKILATWAEPLDILYPGIAFKQYPCCASTHPAIDCMLDLVKQHQLKPEQVARIDSWTHKRRLEHTNRANPQSALDAKFSVQYVLARALINHAVKVDQFEGIEWQDPATRALMTKIHVDTYTTAQFPVDNHFGAEVKVTLTDGRVISTKVDQTLGRAAGQPLPDAQLKTKFELCAERVFDAAASARLYAQIHQFEQLKDVRSVTALTASTPQAHAVAA
jgi:2-methylcitrate dehydratase PrpD